MRARGAQEMNTPSGVAQPSRAAATGQPTSQPSGPFGSLGRRFNGAMAGRRIFSAPERTQSRPPDIEMANNSTGPNTSSEVAPATDAGNGPSSLAAQPNPQDCTPSQNRREWARQRALNLLGTRHAPASDVDDDETGPRWRRTLRKAFPGFR